MSRTSPSTELEREFIDASRSANELELARRQRQNRRLKLSLAGVAVLLALAVVAGIIALLQRQSAKHQATVALARQLGSEAVVEPRIDRAMLLAHESVNLNGSPETEGTLLATLLRSPAAVATFTLPIDVRPCCGMSVSPDGGTLAISDNANNVRFVDTKTRRVRKVVPNFGYTQPVAYAADGSALLDFGGEGVPEIRVLDPGTLRLKRTLHLDRQFLSRPTESPPDPFVVAPNGSALFFVYHVLLTERDSGGGIRRPMAPADREARSDGSGRREGNQRSRSRRRRQSVAGRRRFTAHGSRCRHAEEGSDSPASSRARGRDQIGWAGGRGRVGGRIDLVRRSLDRPSHSRARWAFGLGCPSRVLSGRSHARHDRGGWLGDRLGRKDGATCGTPQRAWQDGRSASPSAPTARRSTRRASTAPSSSGISARRAGSASPSRPRGEVPSFGVRRTAHSAAGSLTGRLRVRRAPRPLARRILLRGRAPPPALVQGRAQRRRQDALGQGRPDSTRRERDRVVAFARDRRGRKQWPGSTLEPARQAAPRSSADGTRTRRTTSRKR